MRLVSRVSLATDNSYRDAILKMRPFAIFETFCEKVSSPSIGNRAPPLAAH
jgi:hypothetical protein